MIIEQRLTEYLKAYAPLVAVVEDRVYFGRAPQPTAFDYVVISLIAGGQIRRVSFGAALFQVSYFSKSEFRAVAGAEILVAALDGYTGTWGTAIVSGDYRDNQVIAEEDNVYHAPVEVRINYLEV